MEEGELCMFLAHLWHIAVKRPASDRSQATGSGARQQVIRPCRQSPGVGLGRRFALFLRQAALSPPQGRRDAIAALVVLTALLAAVIPAAAQHEYEVISNDEQPVSESGAIITDEDRLIAQRFTTGWQSNGYTLDSVKIKTEDGESLPPEQLPPSELEQAFGDFQCTGTEESLLECPYVGRPFSIYLCKVLPSGYPDRSTCTRLARPGSFPIERFLTFKAPSRDGAKKIFLAPNTTYTLLALADEAKKLVYVFYSATDSDAEDEQPSLGWAIWDSYDHHVLERLNPHNIWNSHPTQSLRIQIKSIIGTETAVINSVDVTSTPPSGSYDPGDVIEVTVAFNDNVVTVEGDPEFIFQLGDRDTAASYDAEESTDKILVFKYTVQAGDEDLDGIWIGNGPGTFRLDADDRIWRSENAIDVLLDHNAPGTLPDHTVGAPISVPQQSEPPLDDTAQSRAPFLVSNYEQASREEGAEVYTQGDRIRLSGQIFTTGANAAGYGLTSIRANFVSVTTAPTHVTASIWTVTPTDLPLPQAKQFDLLSPTELTTTGEKIFTAPAETTLTAATRYAVVFTTDGDIALGVVTVGTEDAGGAPGWSLLDHHLGAFNEGWSLFGLETTPLQLEVRGTILTSDATLSALALLAAADDSPIVLRPAFASDLTSYTASVANGVDEITVAATPSHAEADVAYLDAESAPIPDADPVQAGRQVALAVGETPVRVEVTAEDSTTTQTYTVTVTRAPPPLPPKTDSPPDSSEGSSRGSRDSSEGSSRGSRGSSEGSSRGSRDSSEGSSRGSRGSSEGSSRGSRGSSEGSSRSSRDDHGNTPAQATRVRPGSTAPWASDTPGQLNPATDVDYFSVDVPQAGVMVVETTGSTDTVGTVWQAGEEVATDDQSGTGRNFRLRVPVEAGAVVVAVAGAGRQTGRYTLQTRLLVGALENPEAASFQSGLGVISGWVCAAETVEIELNGVWQPAAYGTERGDTEAVCGDTATGFGLLFNWNLLGDGEHEVVARVDGIELARATVTVTTLGQEFVRDVAGTCEVADFPTVGEQVTLSWQEATQNFVLTDGLASAVARTPRSALEEASRGRLENPPPASFQSGIGVISGWVCEAAAVVIELGDLAPQVAAYGTERGDTEAVCGDTATGFGLVFNWNLLGDGEHEVVAYVDAEELGRATVRVTTLGEEFVPDAQGQCVVDDFPRPGQTVTLTWQTAQQNFVLTAVE